MEYGVGYRFAPVFTRQKEQASFWASFTAPNPSFALLTFTGSHRLHCQMQKPTFRWALTSGGERGIRTLAGTHAPLTI